MILNIYLAVNSVMEVVAEKRSVPERKLRAMVFRAGGDSKDFAKVRKLLVRLKLVTVDPKSNWTATEALQESFAHANRVREEWRRQKLD